MLYRKDDKADQLVQLFLSWFSLAKLIPLAPPISKGTFESIVSPLSPDIRPDGLIETSFINSLTFISLSYQLSL